jgi:hypothetical protein
VIAQTLVRRDTPSADIVIVDECHLQFEKINKWITSPAWSAVPFVGLSATPWSRGLGKSYDDLLRPVSIQELIAEWTGAFGLVRKCLPCRTPMLQNPFALERRHGLLDQGKSRNNENRPALFAKRAKNDFGRDAGFPGACRQLQNWAAVPRSKGFAQ